MVIPKFANIVPAPPLILLDYFHGSENKDSMIGFYIPAAGVILQQTVSICHILSWDSNPQPQMRKSSEHLSNMATTMLPVVSSSVYMKSGYRGTNL